MSSIKRLHTIVAGFVLLGAAFGCSSVKSVNPLGEAATAEALEKINIEGTWRINDQAIHIKLLESGKVKIAGLEWSEDHFKVNELDGEVRVDDGLHYLNLVIKDEKTGEQHYAFIRLLESDKEHLVFCGANAHEFEKAIAAGDLQGDVEQANRIVTVTLKSTTEQLNAYLTPERANTLFHLEKPGVLTRIGHPTKK